MRRPRLPSTATPRAGRRAAMGQMPAGQRPRSSLLFHSSHILGGVLSYQVWDACLTEVDTRWLAWFLLELLTHCVYLVVTMGYV